MLRSLKENTRQTPPKVNRVDKKQLEAELSAINMMIGTIETTDIGETNDLILAGAFVVTKRARLKEQRRDESR